MRRLVIGATLLVAASFGYTLLSESFDGSWSTNNPPAGWRIYHSVPGDSGPDDWHREPANTSPWLDHPTPYAQLMAVSNPDAPPDSLVSPTINCSGYRHVTLTCSTLFIRWSSVPYVAKLVYSIDGGATWPYTLRDYYLGSSPGPVLESFHLEAATDQPQVQLAWVFDSTVQRIQWWCVDDVEVTGESIPPWDVQCWRITAPPPALPPGLLIPAARFRNQGVNLQVNIPVACSLYDDALVGLAAWSDTIDTLWPDSVGIEVPFVPPYDLPEGRYFIRFWCAADSDDVRGNDTLTLAFEATLLRELGYDDGNAVEFKSWPVGHYGWGVTFNADTFPYYLESLKVYLRTPANVQDCRYQLGVFLDDGAGQPGKLYYRTPVLTATPGTEAWNSVFLADTGEQLVMQYEQFHVVYMQVGEPPECPALGRDASRTPSVNYWQYRNGALGPDSAPGDFMIRAVINLSPVTPALVDLRTLYVDQPLYDFVQRPFDAPVSPRARAENSGSETVKPVVVQCDIIGPGSVLYYSNVVALDSLLPGQDTLVAFPDWIPTKAERCSVVMATYNPLSPVDSVPQNDEKRFTVDVLKGVHTGRTTLKYAWIDSDTTGGPTFAWIDTNGFSNIGDLGDNGSVPVYFEPGMRFRYYDSTYDRVLVSANGWVSLGPSGGTQNTTPDKLPSPTEPNRCIYPWWDDLAQGALFGRGLVYHRWFGVRPNRYMVLVFKNVNRVGTDTANGITFEIIFRENGTILCQYLDVETGDPAFDYGRSACIGLENGDGSDGLNYLYARPPMSTAVNDPANRLSSGRAILFFAESRDAAARAIVKPEGYLFPGPVTPQAKIQNYGTVSDSIQVFMHIGRDYSDSAWVTDLLPGDSTIVSFAVWDAQTGSYAVVCSTRMREDADSTNNQVGKYVTVTSWARRADIPAQWRRRRVKNAGLCYASTTKRLYAIKGSNTVDFWTYDPAADVWDTLRSIPLEPSGSKPRDGCHLAFDPTHGALGSVWALKGGSQPDFYRYDIATDAWYQHPPAVVEYKNLPTGMTHDYRPPRKGAAIEYVPEQGEQGAIFAIPGNNTNYIWYYDIAGDSWTYPHSGDTDWFPYDIPSGPDRIRCKFGSDLAYLDGKLYVLKGSGTLEAYAFTPGLPPTDDPWKDALNLETFKGTRSRKVKAGGSLVAHEERLYALKGGNTQEFWTYHPNLDSWQQMADIPLALTGRRVRVKRGSAMASVDTTIYCLKGSNSYEFWEYKPSADVQPRSASAASREGVAAYETTFDQTRPWLLVYPNPTRTGLTLSYNLTDPASTHLRIYDAAGKLAADLSHSPRPRGRHTAYWNGLTAQGNQAAAGVYFVKLQSGDTRLTQKFVIQR